MKFKVVNIEKGSMLVRIQVKLENGTNLDAIVRKGEDVRESVQRAIRLKEMETKELEENYQYALGLKGKEFEI